MFLLNTGSHFWGADQISVLLLVFLFAWGLKTVITAKVGEIAVEKLFVWMISKAPNGLTKNILQRIYDPIHRFLELLEAKTREMRDLLDSKLGNAQGVGNSETAT